MRKFFGRIHFLVFSISLVFAQFSFGKEENLYLRDDNPSMDQKLQQIITACKDTASRDPICLALVELQQIGDDTIEVVKEYIKLTPEQYAILTTVNMLAQGRLRMRSRSYFFENGMDTLDIRKDEVRYVFELSF